MEWNSYTILGVSKGGWDNSECTPSITYQSSTFQGLPKNWNILKMKLKMPISKSDVIMPPYKNLCIH